jgi:hypothetical protein
MDPASRTGCPWLPRIEYVWLCHGLSESIAIDSPQIPTIWCLINVNHIKRAIWRLRPRLWCHDRWTARPGNSRQDAYLCLERSPSLCCGQEIQMNASRSIS